MTVPIPTSNHNQALTGDVLYSAFLNYEWRQIVLPYIVRGMVEIAATITDESERQAFEVRYGAMIDDFYNEEVMDSVPIGAITAFVGLNTAIPDKWLLCDGDLYVGTDYPDLYAVLDDIFKDAFGNFTVPDMQDRFLYGSGISDAVGTLGGANQHILTVDEIPAHTHLERSNLGVGALEGIGRRIDAVSSTVTTATQTASTGGGAAHNNMPQYIAVHWIVKALP